MGRGWGWARLFGGGGGGDDEESPSGMEVEVRVVGGVESCFAALPLHVIHTLQATRGGGPLPPLLALHLRTASRLHVDAEEGDAVAAAAAPRWTLAWSGAASSSSAVEVSHHLAECISLPDNTRVHLGVVSVLPKADFVTIEPTSEDDWEILELNYRSAEEAILKQVGIVYEGMRFPLWLNGHNVVKFSVIACSPVKTTVQLVPGTEVAVAPKTREKNYPCQDIKKQMQALDETEAMAFLRVQAADEMPAHKFEYNGVVLGVAQTHVVHIHPKTAQKFSFANLQFVVVLPSILQSKTAQTGKGDAQKKGPLVFNKGITSQGAGFLLNSRQIVVRLLFSEAVTKGHIMLHRSLRCLLRANVHAWVYVKNHPVIVKNDSCAMTISPFLFKSIERKADVNSRMENLGWDTYGKDNSLYSGASAIMIGDILGLLNREKHTPYSLDSKETSSNANDASSCGSKHGKKLLINSWISGQLKAISLRNNQNSIILPTLSFLHFEVIDGRLRGKTFDLLFMLSLTPECHQDGSSRDCFELLLNSETTGLECLESSLTNLVEGELMSLDSGIECSWRKQTGPNLSCLSWMEPSVTDVIKRLCITLSSTSRKFFCDLDCPFPGHIFIHGPSGSGKTALIQSAVRHVENNKDILAHIVYIGCKQLASQKSQKVKQTIELYVSEALLHSPSIVVFDDLDQVISNPSQSEGSQSVTINALANYLIEIMDDYRDNNRNSCGYGPIAFIASAESLGKIPQALTSSGRFDFHVQLSAPGAHERTGMLKYELQKRNLHCPDDTLSLVASKCDGYDGYDLEILVDRASHVASGRLLSLTDDHLESGKPILLMDDFLNAMNGFVPISMRGISSVASQSKIVGWDNVGGLKETISTIRETIELPSKHPALFAKAPLRLRSNVLLFGPPGCGKTHLVAAAAAASSLRIISIKGPELLNKYIGASEEAVRNLFAKAVGAAPCLLFFDEFDSIAPKRGHDNTGVTDRVVNQLLTELDGVETLSGIFVFAATSRPDLLDAALLRPGRFDRLLYCGFPEWNERVDILRVLSLELPLARNVDLHEIATLTEGLSGADLQGLVSDAQLAAVNELVDGGAADAAEGAPVISHDLLRSIALNFRPSVSEDEKRRLHEIYSQFMNSRKSLSSQARDMKGKRATLA